MSMTAGTSLSNLISNFYKEDSRTTYFLFIGRSTFVIGPVIVLLSRKLTGEMGFSKQTV